ncbi:MAG: flagellar hook-associated protein FlgL [bacterium]
MAIRTTYGMMSRNVLYNLNNISNRMSNLQNDISSTVKIHKPSDDPVGAGKTLRLTTSLEKNDQYRTNSDYALSWTDATETALSSLDSVMQRARELAVKANSTATTNYADRQAIADEIDTLYDQVIEYGNANLDGRYIFGGTTTQTKPFADDGTRTNYTYNGNTEKISLVLGQGVEMEINRFGEEPFGTCLKALSEFSTALKNDDTLKLPDCITNINSALNTVIANRSENGSLTNRFEMVQDRLGYLELNYTELLSSVYDTDFPQAITELTKAQTTQQASLSVAAKILQTSLVDFLS